MNFAQNFAQNSQTSIQVKGPCVFGFLSTRPKEVTTGLSAVTVVWSVFGGLVILELLAVSGSSISGTRLAMVFARLRCFLSRLSL